MKFALNRLDMSGPLAFAESAARIEDLGWHMGLMPCNPLKAPDPYLSLAFAAQATAEVAKVRWLGVLARRRLVGWR